MLAAPEINLVNLKIKKDSKLVDLGAKDGDKFKIALGKDDKGDVILRVITIGKDDTIDSLISKINECYRW